MFADVIRDYLPLLCSVLLTALSQTWQKQVALRLEVPGDVVSQSGAVIAYVKQLASMRETWFAVLSLVVSMLLWLWVLLSMDVSKAFPVVSFSLVLVMLISQFAFSETIPFRRWLGAVVITVGVFLVASS